MKFNQIALGLKSAIEEGNYAIRYLLTKDVKRWLCITIGWVAAICYNKYRLGIFMLFIVVGSSANIWAFKKLEQHFLCLSFFCVNLYSVLSLDTGKT